MAGNGLPDAAPPARYRRPPLAVIVQQHVEDAAQLRLVRSLLVRAPHVRLLQLGRLDERLAAQLDGIAVAGPAGAAASDAALDPPCAAQLFVAMVLAIETRDLSRLRRLLTIADVDAEARRGALSAFGWVSAAALSGLSKTLLTSSQPLEREAGMAACAMHGVDPGAELLRETIGHPNTLARLGAWTARTAVAVGHVKLREACLDSVALAGADAVVRFECTRAALLLGERHRGEAALALTASSGHPRLRDAALSLLLKCQSPDAALRSLAALRDDPVALRSLIRAVGVAGHPQIVEWLIERMDNLALARLAGESFCLITGLDLASLDLDRKPPADMNSGPNDDATHSNVAIDEDDSLPWPDPAKIAACWRINSSRFTPGTRYFMGQPPTFEHCFSVLQTGFQRQRRHAAEYLCLLRPGTPLFNIAAPAWRQKRLLAQMAGG